jgi:DNA-binding MarR family transcriptional regulator
MSENEYAKSLSGFFNTPPKQEFEHQWGSSVALYKFTQVPNALLNCQGHLKLDDGELLTYIHLVSFRFHSYSEIFPSIKTLCMFSHKSYPTVQKRLKRLESKGYIKRIRRFNSSNKYDITPGIRKLSKHLKNCPRTPRIFEKAPVINEAQYPSLTTNKEYEDKTLTTNNTETLSFSGQNILKNPVF